MEKITFRPAEAADSDRIVEIILGEPDQVSTQIGLKLFDLKNIDQAKRMFGSMAKSSQSWRATILAEHGGASVGILQSNAPSMALSLRLVITAVLLYGPFFMKRLMPRIQLLQEVQTTHPEGAYQISELHVSPEHRGHGLGTLLLEYAENEAVAGGYPSMALQTWTANPAVHLYERYGFRIVETKTSEQFKELTGVDGNYLMVKELASPG